MLFPPTARDVDKDHGGAVLLKADCRGGDAVAGNEDLNRARLLAKQRNGFLTFLLFVLDPNANDGKPE